jgi:hypothetical protein
MDPVRRIAMRNSVRAECRILGTLVCSYSGHMSVAVAGGTIRIMVSAAKAGEACGEKRSHLKKRQSRNCRYFRTCDNFTSNGNPSKSNTSHLIGCWKELKGGDDMGSYLPYASFQ